MKNSQKIIVLALCLAILVLATVTVLISHSYFVNNSVLNETVSGRIEGKIPDYTVISMYADGTEIDSMNDVPEGYIIDETNSYCYLSNPEVHDTNVTLHTNSSGEHTFSGLSKGEKCIIYFRKSTPTSYWFDNSGTSYTFPNHGGTLQTSGTATGHNVYIGQNNIKYYTCINYNGKEACLSQPYTQYTGSEIVNNSLSTEQQNAAKASIGEVFSDAGITGYSCSSDSYYVRCGVGDFYCNVGSSGDVDCAFTASGEGCIVNADGSAEFYIFPPTGGSSE